MREGIKGEDRPYEGTRKGNSEGQFLREGEKERADHYFDSGKIGRERPYEGRELITEYYYYL